MGARIPDMPCDAWVLSTRARHGAWRLSAPREGGARHGAWRLFERGCDAVGRFRVLRTMKAPRRSGLPRCRFRRCDERCVCGCWRAGQRSRAVLWAPCVTASARLFMCSVGTCHLPSFHWSDSTLVGAPMTTRNTLHCTVSTSFHISEISQHMKGHDFGAPCTMTR